MPLRPYRQELEALHARYDDRRYVHPDPLEAVLRYDDPGDREVAALLASALAYGRVQQILRSVQGALERMQPGPLCFLREASSETLRRTFVDFRHRFAAGEQVASLLYGAKRMLEEHGSLEACFSAGLRSDHETVLPALSAFVRRLSAAAGGKCGHLLPDPARGSACKRMNLFLRWMVRRDNVDPGGWQAVPAAMLIVPLDTHMHKIGLALGASRRKTADLRTALEITEAFRAIRPDDPARYDFALTRLAIRGELPGRLFSAIRRA